MRARFSTYVVMLMTAPDRRSRKRGPNARQPINAWVMLMSMTNRQSARLISPSGPSGRFHDGTPNRVAHAVDQDIDVAELCLDVLGEADHRIFVGRVHLKRLADAAVSGDAVDGFFSVFQRKTGNGDIRPRL